MFKLYLDSVLIFWIFSLFFEFSSQGRRGWPDSQSLFVFASLTLRGALQAQRKLRCATAKKVTKKCRNLNGEA